MYLSSILLLPLLVSADLQEWQDRAAGWFENAKRFVPQAAFPDADAGAAHVASKEVQKITIQNWQRKLAPKAEGPQEWLIFMTGGNKTCHGSCDHIDRVFDQSVPLLAARSDCPQLGYVNCDKQDQLCTSWAASVPTFWHFSVPQQQNPQPSSPLHIVALNYTTVTPQEIVALVSEKKYLESEEYIGVLHPIDGFLAQYHLLMPLGYVLWIFGTVPSWLIMIVISFISRQWISKRQMQGIPEPGRPAAARPAGAVPAAGRPKPKKA